MCDVVSGVAPWPMTHCPALGPSLSWYQTIPSSLSPKGMNNVAMPEKSAMTIFTSSIARLFHPQKQKPDLLDILVAPICSPTSYSSDDALVASLLTVE